MKLPIAIISLLCIQVIAVSPVPVKQPVSGSYFSTEEKQAIVEKIMDEHKTILKYYSVQGGLGHSRKLEKLNKLYSEIEKKTITDEELGYLFNLVLWTKFSMNHFNPIEDKELFHLVMKLYLSPSKEIRLSAANQMNFFSANLIDLNRNVIMAPFMKGEFSRSVLVSIPITKKILDDYSPYFKKQILVNRKKLNQISANPAKGGLWKKLNLLRLGIHIGDVEAKKEIIEIFKKTTSADNVFPFLVSILTENNSPETIKVLLPRFAENTGAPDFYTGSSPRYMILLNLYRKYHDDDFFCKYRWYFEPSLNGAPYPLDNESLGGENGVKKLFGEFQQWVKKRFSYDLDLSKSIPKVNMKNRVRKYYK